MKYIARVNPRYFAAAAIWMARNDVRYYLNGVAIQPHPEQGALIIATDGHTIAAIHDPDGWCERDIIVGTIPKQLIAECKAKPRGKHAFEAPRHLWIAESEPSRGGAIVQGGMADDVMQEPASTFDTDALYACKIELVEGRYPDWRRVISTVANKIEEGPDPTDKAALIPATINPQYLVRLAETAKVFGGKYTSVTGYQATKNDVVLYQMSVSGDPEFSGRAVFGIMPMQNDPPAQPIPPAIMLAPKPSEKDSGMSSEKATGKPRVKVRGEEVVTNNEEAAEEATA